MLKKIIWHVKKALSKEKVHYELPKLLKNLEEGDTKLLHFSAFSYRNAGDALLPLAVRDTIEKAFSEGFNWSGIRVHTPVTKAILNEINQSKGMVIGGGGLFLRDTNKNDSSGWQWACPIDYLEKIEVPVILYAVGYNRFRGQEDFDPIFTHHVNKFIEKSAFFGLRNTGSIENMKRYIDPKFHHKIRYQPCPTTILTKIYPEFFKPNQEEQFIAVNCAFDRLDLRIKGNPVEKLESIARVIKKLSNLLPIRYYVHCEADNDFLKYMDILDTAYTIVNLQTNVQSIIEEYAKPSLTIGMRGHAQMIPFGCQTPILSIISHDKMRFFLEDLNHLEWGSEIDSPDFEEDLYNKAVNILDNKAEVCIY
jgi:polysaccharide pyruvyl transferase WcaK-like protein